jgi:hypothetical protein
MNDSDNTIEAARSQRGNSTRRRISPIFWLALPFVLWLLLGLIGGGPGAYSVLGYRLGEPWSTLLLIYSFVGYFIGGPLFLIALAWLFWRWFKAVLKRD